MPQIYPGKSVPLEPATALPTQQPRAVSDVTAGMSGGQSDETSNQPTDPRPIPHIDVGKTASTDRFAGTSIQPPRAAQEVEAEQTTDSESAGYAAGRDEPHAMPEIGTSSITEEGTAEPRPMPDIG